MKHVNRWPTLGLGTWRLGESARTRRAEVAAVRLAIEIGYRLIDTAEMYGDGGAEEVLGAALAEALRAGDCRREELTIVSKVLPSNASLRGVMAACERSRARLGVDCIDLYLLHWPGSHPLSHPLPRRSPTRCKASSSCRRRVPLRTGASATSTSRR
jgi:diketogulonate reductase-like aldo/keto reductase